MRLRIFTEPQQGASYATLRRVATTAEALGFDAFFRSDHLMKMGPGDGLPGPTDSWATLAGLAAETSSIRLGTLVTAATFRLPGPLAIAVAQVDDMSGGRVELGIGTGWYEAEHRAYGVPFPPLKERFDRLEEQLAIITGLWETPLGEKFSFDGTYYQVADSPALPKPVQRPRPPVIIGGGGRLQDPGARRAVRRRVQRELRVRRRRGCAVRTGAGRLPGGGAGPGVDDLHRRAHRLLREGRRGAAPPRRRDRP